MPDRFNEGGLAVLPKGVEDTAATGDIVRAPEVLWPLLLKNTDSETVAATLARAMKPIVAEGVPPFQRGVVAQRDLARAILEVKHAQEQCTAQSTTISIPIVLLCHIAAAFLFVKHPWWARFPGDRACRRRPPEWWTPRTLARFLCDVKAELTNAEKPRTVSDPAGRRLHSALRAARARMSRLCAGDRVASRQIYCSVGP